MSESPKRREFIKMEKGVIRNIFRNLGNEFSLIEYHKSHRLVSYIRSTPKMNSDWLRIGDKVAFTEKRTYWGTEAEVHGIIT